MPLVNCKWNADHVMIVTSLCRCGQAAHDQSVAPEPVAATSATPQESAVPAAGDALLNATAAAPRKQGVAGLFTLHGRKFPHDFKAEIIFAILAVSNRKLPLPLVARLLHDDRPAPRQDVECARLRQRASCVCCAWALVEAGHYCQANL